MLHNLLRDAHAQHTAVLASLATATLSSKAATEAHAAAVAAAKVAADEAAAKAKADEAAAASAPKPAEHSPPPAPPSAAPAPPPPPATDDNGEKKPKKQKMVVGRRLSVRLVLSGLPVRRARRPRVVPSESAVGVGGSPSKPAPARRTARRATRWCHDKHPCPRINACGKHFA